MSTVQTAVKFVGDFQLPAQTSFDGRDPMSIQVFAGQDHYDCVRFAEGAFGATKPQLDCR
eukprot:SAG31_NODE_1034_length_10228_cov_89.107316_12_plen_60_part_00